MSEINRTVWLIDDDAGDADMYKRLLERSQRLDVEAVKVQPSVEDYAYLAADPQTGAVLIDHYLSDGAGVSYEGTDLAEFLRVLRAELPIYILTNYAPAAEEQESDAVDSIIDKENVRKHTNAYVSRILRAMQRYEEAMGEKKHRIKDLVDQKISRELTDEEEVELAALRADINRPIDFAIVKQNEQRETELQQQEQQLEKLQEMASSLLEELKGSRKQG